MANNQTLPIVLAHGIARFDILLEILRTKAKLPETTSDDRFQYFKGIRTHLEGHGFRVFHPNQDFAGPVDLRAEQLAARVNEVIANTGADKVHIIGHSMGGLDARHMIVDKGMAEKVATLTTIGTPHLGTIFADHMIDHGGVLLMESLRPVLNLDGFADLTVAACERFNRRAEDFEATNNVVYQTYASAEDLLRVFAPLGPSWIFIRDHDGKNDGLVPFKSQQWQRELIANDGARKAIAQKEFPIPADHLNQVGWWDPQEAINPRLLFTSIFKQAGDYERKIKDVYLEIAQQLA
ncbi:MAG TPA: alpha/beta fold hydrolase [Pyrinomonadaceae bacterium]|jgi:triacylglycerol lipase|nr:alpha/beta fold hydrolase [Pyrinomonadaceae bacterium]